MTQVQNSRTLILYVNAQKSIPGLGQNFILHWFGNDIPERLLFKCIFDILSLDFVESIRAFTESKKSFNCDVISVDNDKGYL